MNCVSELSQLLYSHTQPLFYVGVFLQNWIFYFKLLSVAALLTAPLPPYNMPVGMGRYCPPQKPGSKYITPEDFERLLDELDYLWRVEWSKITQNVQEGGKMGQTAYVHPCTRGIRLSLAKARLISLNKSCRHI